MQAASARTVPLEQLAAKIRQVWARCGGEADTHTSYSQVSLSLFYIITLSFCIPCRMARAWIVVATQTCQIVPAMC